MMMNIRTFFALRRNVIRLHCESLSFPKFSKEGRLFKKRNYIMHTGIVFRKIENLIGMH